MRSRTIPVWAALTGLLVLSHSGAQRPDLNREIKQIPKKGKVHEVPPEGLVIDDHLTKNDKVTKQGNPFKEILVKLTDGKTYALYLESKDFDAFLMVKKGGEILAEDDDSGGGTDARLVLAKTAAGDYIVGAFSLDKKLGAFRLRVRQVELTQQEIWEAEARSLNLASVRLTSQKRLSQALRKAEKALEIRQKLYRKEEYPNGHPDLAKSLYNIGRLLQEKGDLGPAVTYFQKSLSMRRLLFPEPQDHISVAKSLHSLAGVLGDLGKLRESLPYIEQALAMRQRLYSSQGVPQDHLEVADTLNDMGGIWLHLGEPAKALSYVQQSLDMAKRLFPQVHHAVAQRLNNLGGVHGALGHTDNELSYFQQALAMRRQLFPEKFWPQGHPDIANSLANVGMALGDSERALHYLEQSLAMTQRLYPEKEYDLGHFELAVTLKNVGDFFHRTGKPEQAITCLEKALVMFQKLMDRQIRGLSEAEALASLRRPPRTLDAYLSLTRHAPEKDAAAIYAHIWSSKALLSRLLQRRHEATRIAVNQSKEVQLQWQELLDVRHRLVQVYLQPAKDLVSRDKKLRDLTDERESLERSLAQVLPEMASHKELAQLTPTDLVQKLPADTVFLDFIHHRDWEKGKMVGFRYAVFVVSKKAGIKRLDLGQGKPIDEAIATWRQAIEGFKNSPAEAELGKLVWAKIAPLVPEGTKVIYLAPDGDLARMPFTALPGKQPGRVLLEDYVLAQVPHGPFLLEKLRYPPPAPPGMPSLLALGGVSPDLPASAREIEQIEGLESNAKIVLLKGPEATPGQVGTLLPRMHYAHFATHGFFMENSLIEERRRLDKQMKDWHFQKDQDSQPVVIGARNPLVYTGLVLAGANADHKAGPDADILTGEAIVEMPLEGLQLVVLSACATGLGDLTEGEGVAGLQRAFHLAGCPNVVASLWNVNDQATAALMAKFYHGLLKEGKSPVAALRQAQLTILRHPERIADLADRGQPHFDKTVQLPVDMTPPSFAENSRRAPTKLWAAFLLSGVGRMEGQDDTISLAPPTLPATPVLWYLLPFLCLLGICAYMVCRARKRWVSK